MSPYIAWITLRLSLRSRAWHDMRPFLYVLLISRSCLHLSGIQILYHSYAYIGDYEPLDSDVFVQIGFLLSLVLLLWEKVTKRSTKSVLGFYASTTWSPILSLLSVCLMRLGFSQITCSTCFFFFFIYFILVPVREWFSSSQSRSGSSSILPSFLSLLLSKLFLW